MYRVIFFGNPDFVVPVLNALREMKPEIELVAVVTSPDGRVGRTRTTTHLPVKEWTQENHVDVLAPESLDSSFVAQLRRYQPTVGVIAAYGKIISQSVLDIFPKGVLNIHPSLLPRWRGPSPVQAAIVAGDTETGVTLMLTDAEMDHGPILDQTKIQLRGTETSDNLTQELFQMGAEVLRKNLLPWLRGDIETIPQTHSKAAYSKKLTKDAGRINWMRSSEEISRYVRAYQPWPSTFVFTSNGTRLKILQVSTDDFQNGASPGTVMMNTSGEFLVRTGSGWIRIDSVQREGAHPIDGGSFLRGHMDLIGKVFK